MMHVAVITCANMVLLLHALHYFSCLFVALVLIVIVVVFSTVLPL